MFRPQQETSMAEVFDGTSNTIMLGEHLHLLQQPVDGQLIHDPRVGDFAKTQGGEVLVDLGIARLKVVHAIEQWHGGWKCWMSHDGV